jgi:rare lipoprotein A
MLSGKARAQEAVRIVTGFAVVCGVLAAAPAWAQAPRTNGQGATITYIGSAQAASNATLASKPMPVLPTPSVVPGVFNDPTTQSPPQQALPKTQPLDIRPGAFKNSFGPMPSTLAKPEQVAPAALTSRPVATPAASAVSGAPYAGAPYQVEGKWFVPMYEPNYDEVGTASWYGPNFHGKAAATGETYDQMAMTAAHPTLPIPSLVRVTNLENGKSVIVRLNDRGPFVDDRIIDMSKAAAQALEMTGKGTAKVRVQYVGPVTPAATPASLSPSVGSYAPVVQQVAQIAPAKSPALAPQAASAGFYLQAGAFADISNAYALRDKLAAVGPASIVEGQSNGQRLYRVMAGPWASRDEAERKQDMLANSGLKALIVARN